MTHRVLVISYDFKGQAIHDAQLMEGKVTRMSDWADASLLFIAWSKKRESLKLSKRIEVEAFPAFVGVFRPLYDFLSIFVGPYIARKRGEHPESIVVYEFPLLWAAAMTKLFVGGTVELRLTTLPTELAATFGAFHRYYYRIHELLAWRLADRFVVINEATKMYVRRLGVSEEKIRVQAPDTIARDKAYIQNAQKGVIRTRYHIAETMPIVLSVGRLEVEKGYPELLELFAASRVTAKLIIVGEGSLRAALEKKVRELHIEESVILAGWQDRAAIWNFYADADAFVLLSHSESLGVVFWEAMYMHVPVIGRPIGGIPETIGKDGERGFLWNTKDGVEAFREKLGRAIRRESDVVKMIERAYAFVEEKIDTP